MKETRSIKNIIFIIGIFIIALIAVVLVFQNNIRYIKLKNKTKELVNYVNKLDTDTYHYKKGVLYDSKSNVVTTDYYINGDGYLKKDKYDNIELLIKLEDRCVYKTYLGKVSTGTECSNKKDMFVKINRNNSQITFISDTTISEYLFSKKDDFKGEWTKLNSKKLILNIYEEGEYYIWFRDKYGNLSSTQVFEISCLLSDLSDYDENILYCSGSIIQINDENWSVIKDKDKELTLMRVKPLEKTISHTKDSEEYKWSSSIINKYLNEEYIKELDDSIVDKLISVKICDEPSGKEGCDSKDGCGGYKKEVIDENKWKCSKYTDSKIRIVSYDEYNALYENTPERILIYGPYWTINSYKTSLSGISVLPNGEVFTGELTDKELPIRPVITISR